MKGNKMMDQALVNMFGEENTTTNLIDALVAEDEAMIADCIKAKNRRAVRVESKKNVKIRNKRTYDPSDVHHWGKKAVFNEFRGITPIFHGSNEPVAFVKKSRKNVTTQTYVKTQNRKERYSGIPTDGAYLRVNTEEIFANYVECGSYTTINWDGKWLTITVNAPNVFNGQYYDWRTWLTPTEAINRGYMEYSDTPQYSYHWECDNYKTSGDYMNGNYRTPALATTIADSTGFLAEWKTLKLEELAQAKLDAITAMEEVKLACLKLKVAENRLEIARMEAELAK